MLFKRFEGNPIVIPGKFYWRGVASFNPGIVVDDKGTFWMLERACSSLAPMHSQFGLLKSTDGFHFDHVVDYPVFTPEMLGTARGTVEDPRLIKMGNTYYMTYVHRNYVSSCIPTGIGLPNYHAPAGVPSNDPNNYRSGIATSEDLIKWNNLGMVTPIDLDDRDCVLFPEKIGGRFAMLRRPMNFVGKQYGCEKPGIWVSFSDNVTDWTQPQLVAAPEGSDWEKLKIGAATPPVLTDKGWLVLYHGVDASFVYRLGVMMLDLNDPTKVIARSPEALMEPEAYYEMVGLVIPRVIFPSGCAVKNGTLYIYYGCCDTSIGVATVALEEIVKYVLGFKR